MGGEKIIFFSFPFSFQVGSSADLLIAAILRVGSNSQILERFANCISVSLVVYTGPLIIVPHLIGPRPQYNPNHVAPAIGCSLPLIPLRAASALELHDAAPLSATLSMQIPDAIQRNRTTAGLHGSLVSNHAQRHNSRDFVHKEKWT